jgi:hypothetical protein
MDPRSIFDLQFVGTHSAKVEVNGQDYLIYSYNVDKMLSSFAYKHKSFSSYEGLAKLCSVAKCVFAEPCFQVMRTYILDHYIPECMLNGSLTMTPSVSAEIANLEPWRIIQLFFRYESGLVFSKALQASGSLNLQAGLKSRDEQYN